MTIRNIATLLALSSFACPYRPACGNLLKDQPGATSCGTCTVNPRFSPNRRAQSKARRMAQGVRAYWAIGLYRWPLLGLALGTPWACSASQLDYSSDAAAPACSRARQKPTMGQGRIQSAGLTAKLRPIIRTAGGHANCTYCRCMYNDSRRLLPQDFSCGWLRPGSGRLELRPGAASMRSPARLRRPSKRMTPVHGRARNVIVSGNADSTLLTLPAR